MSEKQGLPVDNSASPQTIPPAALRDIPGALSFSTLLPKSPGQLLHPLRKVFQAFRFLKPTRYEVPEQTARRQHGAAGRLSASRAALSLRPFDSGHSRFEK